MIEAVALEEAAAAATASTCFASDGPRLTLSFRGSSGGHLQSSAPFERTLQLWDWASRRRVRSMPELVSDATYLSVATSTDGSLLATGDANGSLQIYDAITTEVLHTLSLDLVQPAPSSYDSAAAAWTADNTNACPAAPTLCAAFSPDGTLISSGGSTGLVSIWHVASGQCVSRCAGHAERLLVYSSSARMAFA